MGANAIRRKVLLLPALIAILGGWGVAGDKPPGETPAEAPRDEAPGQVETYEKKTKSIDFEGERIGTDEYGKPIYSGGIKITFTRERGARPVSNDFKSLSACTSPGLIVGIGDPEWLVPGAPFEVGLTVRDRTGRSLREDSAGGRLVPVAPPPGMEGLATFQLELDPGNVTLENLIGESPDQDARYELEGRFQVRPQPAGGRLEVAALLTCAGDVGYFERFDLDPSHLGGFVSGSGAPSKGR